MKNKIIIAILGVLLFSFKVQDDFLTQQKKFERFSTAIAEKQSVVERKLNEYQLLSNNFNLLFVAYKDNDVLDVYAKAKDETSYKKIVSYDICARSGTLGPKRQQGDGQVPEGLYYIDRFNPESNFYLSLSINYPNQSDRIKSKEKDLGGDIFIHGFCATVGCLPMTVGYIKEIYLLAVHAKNNGQTHIPVYIFPFKMTDQNMESNKDKYKQNKELVLFWENLKVGYDKFINNPKELEFKVAKNGDYVF